MLTIKNRSQHSADASNRRTAVRDLWREAFGDTEDYMDWLFAEIYRDGQTWTCEENGQVLGALQAVPWPVASDGGTLQTVYLLGVSVRAACRGRGIGTFLVEEACRGLASAGVHQAALVPAGPHLVAWYERLGFVVKDNWPLPPRLTGGMEAAEFTPWQQTHVMVRSLSSGN